MITQPEEAENTKWQNDYLPGPQEGQRLGTQFLLGSPCQIQLLSLRRIKQVCLISKIRSPPIHIDTEDNHIQDKDEDKVKEKEKDEEKYEAKD